MIIAPRNSQTIAALSDYQSYHSVNPPAEVVSRAINLTHLDGERARHYANQRAAKSLIEALTIDGKIKPDGYIVLSEGLIYLRHKGEEKKILTALLYNPNSQTPFIEAPGNYLVKSGYTGNSIPIELLETDLTKILIRFFRRNDILTDFLIWPNAAKHTKDHYKRKGIPFPLVEIVNEIKTDTV